MAVINLCRPASSVGGPGVPRSLVGWKPGPRGTPSFAPGTQPPGAAREPFAAEAMAAQGLPVPPRRAILEYESEHRAPAFGGVRKAHSNETRPSAPAVAEARGGRRGHPTTNCMAKAGGNA
jgi:hypothetical protein